MKNIKKYVFKSIAISMIAALAINMIGCNVSMNTDDTSSESLVSEIVSDETPDEFQDGEIVDEVEPADDDPDDNKSVASTSATTATTKKATTTTTKKSIFDFLKPDNTTTTKKTTTTTKNSTTTTKKATTTTKNTTTTTTKNTTTTTQSAVKTSYEISVNVGMSISASKTSSALYKKWGNSGIESQGSLFGANYVLVKDTYGGMSLKCSNASLNDDIIVKSSNTSIVSIAEVKNTTNYTGVTLKAAGTGTATITASIPNNSKTFSFTVKVVTESDVISKYESKVMSLINEYRSNAGVAKLTTASNLKSPARTRAKECSQSFSHTRPNGTSFATAFQSAYSASEWHVNENIAKGQSLPGNAVKAWYNSSGHRTTMLSTHYTKGNVGLYIADNGTFYWALEVVGPSGATIGDDTSSTSEENSSENSVENNVEE